MEQILSNYIMPIASILMVFVTAALVFLTFKYLRATKRMANAMEKEFEVRTKPIVNVTFEGKSYTTLFKVGLKFRIENTGSYAVMFLNYRLDASHKDFQNEYFYSASMGKGLYINSGDNYDFVDEHDFDNVKQYLKNPEEEEAEIFLNIIFYFSDILDKKFDIKTRYRITSFYVPETICGD